MKADKVLPVYRVNNREENLNFFRIVLGMKVLLEEGPMVELGGYKGRETRVLLEESPSADGYSAAGTIKKHRRTVILANVADVEQLSQENLDAVKPVKFDGNTGFSAISPEGDEFWLIGTDKFYDSVASGLSDFEVAELVLNVSSIALAKQDFAIFEDLLKGFNLKLHEKKPEKLKDTWDIESIQVQMSKDTDLKLLANQFGDYHPYLDAEGRLLTAALPDGIELWFEK